VDLVTEIIDGFFKWIDPFPARKWEYGSTTKEEHEKKRKG
jgi:hypothetical protein